MTYTLYNRDGSGGFVVEAALALADAPFELVKLDTKPGEPLPEAFRAVNPWGQVPVLIMPDGSTLTETAAILIHLAACHPKKALAPLPGTPEHARFLRWMVFTSANVYEAVLRISYPFRYTTDANALQATRDCAVRRMGESLSVIEAEFGDGQYLLGDALTVVDVYLAMLFIWFKGEIDAPRLASMTDGVRQHAVIHPIWRRHFRDR